MTELVTYQEKTWVVKQKYDNSYYLTIVCQPYDDSPADWDGAATLDPGTATMEKYLDLPWTRLVEALVTNGVLWLKFRQ